ncbi:MAG TPA: sulfite reductase [Rhodospirillaceae bacterium]|nr:sulfite reductase [Rhodospirillaceae bacterium]MAX64466.1 sulfite reductase [Rhodospirillaceae bacterium]MBB58373.1 sulfite reductase [Rhodospirillaceae bacterium]HAJ19295.1 sulfite reductase [Rhodospirillaceae bacterium]|tara:strand:+ start:2130 stop:3800 length:1671 start_codon:yes stop_codon:yes gene_type:complete
MYRYDEFDDTLVKERVAQFRGQIARRLSGELTEDEFKPLRLMNGLYLQIHAYMLRVAIPYGTFNAKQMRMLAHIGRKYDKDYGHFTTRQNIQFNWIKLEDTADILEDLAKVEMHAIQTSGNCIRNTTADPYAGAAVDEYEDPRIWAEVIRQWSSFHPEFSFLPRKFKIAVTGAPNDRAAVRVHDIGLTIKKNDAGETGFEVMIGGGQGRSPFIAKTVSDFVPRDNLLSYLEAILRVYNMLGRRDNKYKARIKILVHEVGIEEIRRLVEIEWANLKKETSVDLPAEERDRIAAYFRAPDFEVLADTDTGYEARRFEDRDFRHWVRSNVVAHRQPGYAIVNISLKPTGGIPGDISGDQMDAVADIADAYALDSEIRATLQQNLVLPHVKLSDLPAVYDKLVAAGLATGNIGLAGDIIACPGLDYCNLANARAIPIAQQISDRFADLNRQYDIGNLEIKISGCINACGHHHVGHIGILGVDRKGEEHYQLTLGGRADNAAAIGDITGPGFSADGIIDAVENVVETYLSLRQDPAERFIDTLERVGHAPFKENLYGPKAA